MNDKDASHIRRLHLWPRLGSPRCPALACEAWFSVIFKWLDRVIYQEMSMKTTESWLAFGTPRELSVLRTADTNLCMNLL